MNLSELSTIRLLLPADSHGVTGALWSQKCALGDAAAWPIQGLIRAFRDEIEDRIKAKKTGRVTAVAAE